MAVPVATTLLACVLLFNSAYSAPVVPKAESCHDDVLWKSGSSYQYSYTATVQGEAVGTTDRKAGVQITCNVDLSVHNQCRYVLKTTNCGLAEIAAPGVNTQFKKHPRTNEFKEMLAKYPVSFVMSDGEIEGLVAHEQEPISVLNMKRGIISALLSKKGTTPENDFELRTDVHGTCPVHYTSTDNHIEMTAELNKCHVPSQADWHLSPYSFVWNATFAQFWLMDSTLKCSYDLSDGSVSKIVCDEKYASKLEASQDGTATAHTTTHVTLELKGNKADKANFDQQLKNKRVREIQFEWEPTPQPTEQPADFLNNANKLMADLVTSTTSEIKPNTVNEFDKLLKLLRKSPDITQFVNSVINCQFKASCDDNEKETSMSYLRDVVVTCNTVACMRGVRMLASNPEHMSNNYFHVMMYAFTKLKVSEEEYLGEVLKICKARTTRMCLLSLSSMIHSFSARVSHDHHHQPKAVKDTVEYLSKMIGNDCNPDAVLKDMDRFQSIERIILALKSIGNLGSCAQHASNSIVRQLTGCIANHDIPHNVTLQAIRAFRRMEPSPQIYTTLMNVIKNKQELMEERIIAYLVLSKLDQQSKLYEDLSVIFSTEKSSQLQNFVTMHMRNVLLHSDSSLELLQKTIRDAFNKHPEVFVLEGPHPMATSRFREFSRFYTSPNFHDAINKFGIDVQGSAIYETFSYLPQHLIFNLTTQLFGKTFNPLTLGAASHGLEPVIEFLAGPNGLLRQGPIKEVMKELEESGHSVMEMLQDPVRLAEKSWTNHFNDAIENKLEQIHNSVFMEYGKTEHFAAMSVQIHGDELAFTSLDLVKNRIMEFLEKDFYELNWDDFLHYHAHRIIRFIEGRTHLPTMAGLPLHVGTDFTLGMSVRGKVKADVFNLMQIEPFLNAEWRLATSGVLDVTLDAEVEVPKFTSFGFHGHNTGHRSRVRAGELAYKTGDITLKISVPDEPQVLLALHRDNKMVFNGKYEDIPDYQIKRVTKDDCYVGKLSGLKFCRKKSFADVLNDPSKPQVLLAGDFEYRLWYEKDDKALKAYELHVKVDTSKLPEKVTTIEFQAPGAQLRREVKAVIKRNVETKEFNIHFNIPEKKHFRFDVERKLNKEGGQAVGYTTHLDAMFVEGRPITFHGTSRNVEGSKDLNLKLTLKERSLTYERKYQYTPTTKNADATITFESTTTDTYMHDILPDVFWENDHKAYTKFHLSVDKHNNDDEFERKISFSAQSPKHIVELNTERLSRTSNDHRILSFRLDRRHWPSKNLESFILLGYEMVNKEEGGMTKRNHMARFMIPKVRWTVSVDRNFDNVDNKNVAILKRDKATDSTVEVTDSTSVDTWQVKLQVDHHNDSAARNDVFPTPRERHLTIKLTYPRDGKDYTLSYNGQIINDEGQKNALKSFHTDSNIESERFQIKIHAKTDYMRTASRIKAEHKSDITYIPTGKTAKYNLDVDLDLEAAKFDLSQNFDSSFYKFEEEWHILKQGEAFDGTLVIKANSPVWDFLNLDYKQEFHLSTDDSRETVTLKHKLVDIDVKSEFKLPLGRYYKKEFHIKSKSEYIPNVNLYLFHHDYIYYSAHVEYPDDHRNVYAVMEADPSFQGAELEVVYNNEGHDNTTVVEAEAHILTPNAILVDYSVDRQAIRRACQLHSDRLKKIWDRWVEIKNDPEHPMNQFLKPIVKTTLADFQKELIERLHQRKAAIRREILEGLKSLEPIFKPSLDILRGIGMVLERLALKISQHDEDQTRSVAAWFNEYYQVREKLRAFAKHVGQRLVARMNTMTQTTRDGATVINHPFEYKSFTDIPRSTPELARRMQGVGERFRTLKERYYGLRRSGAAYGTLSHVYTFDGKTYDLPNIPNNDCMYLLAHDFVFRRYSMIGQKDSLHILFPEIAITMSRDGTVKFNGTHPAVLPYESWNKRVQVDFSPKTLSVRSTYGLGADLMPEKHIALFHLDFWNHNRTLGMLGNNDNEMKNDYKMLNGKVSENLFEFMGSYEISGKPMCKDRKQLMASPPCDGPVHSNCHMFEESNSKSPLYSCFDIIDPTPFHKSCKTESQCGHSICSVFHAYKLLCQQHGVSTGDHSEC